MIPRALMLSGYHQLTKRWAVMGNIGWQQWSEFGKQDLTLRSTTSTTFTKDLDYDDTLGAAYEYLDAGDAEINQEGGPLQGPLKGDCDTNAIHFFAVNPIWKF